MAFKNQTHHHLLCMTMFIVSITILLASHASSRPIEPELSMLKRLEQWMARHGRVYKDETEKAMRFKTFKENMERIDSFNNNKSAYTYTLGVNKFSDLTKEEFLATYTGFYRTASNLSTVFEPAASPMDNSVSDTSSPGSLDWRQQGAVTDIKNQGHCGCCWAFAAVAAIEGMHQIVTGELVSLSEQELVDCATSASGCSGGNMGHAYDYVSSNGGIAAETSYPYSATDGNSCQAVSSTVQIGGYTYVTPNDENALLEAVSKQPVAVAIDSHNLHQYGSGIFNGPCGDDLIHAVTLIGYGTSDEGQDYWLVKNQWGTSWGEEGYMRIQRNAGVEGGMCGLAIYASYPTPA